MSKLTITYDLMQHFKLMKTADPEKQMQAVCRKNKKAFLSIGDDGRLRVTSDENMRIPVETNDELSAAEKFGSESGWLQKDISEGIFSKMGNNPSIKTFSVGEMGLDSKYILCAVAHDGNQDAVFYSLSASLLEPEWNRVTLPEEIAELPIVGVQINESEQDLFINLHVKQKNNRLQQYFLHSEDGKFDRWEFTPFAADFDEISSTFMGHPKNTVLGSYVLGKIKKTHQVLFTPSYDEWTPGIAPSPSRFAVPKKKDSDSFCLPDCLSAFVVPDSGSATDLFICGSGLLSVYPYDGQHDGAEAVSLMQSEHFNAVEQLFSFESRGRVYVWLLNASKELCYLYADLDERYNPDAWSVVMVLRDGLDYVHMFEENNQNAFYGYSSEGTGVLGSEDGENGLWSYVDVFTSVEEGNPSSMCAFITHIKAIEANTMITLKSKEEGLFEIGSKIYALKKGNMIRVKSDPSGAVNIIQLTELPYAIGFEVMSSLFTSTVNPSKETEKKLLSLDSVDKLRNARIQTVGNLESQPLVPKEKTYDELDAVAQAIASLSTEHQRMNGANNVPEFQRVHLRCYGERIEVVESTEQEFNLLMNGLDDGDEYSSEDVFSFMRSLRSPHSELMKSNGWFDIFLEKVGNICRFVVDTVIDGLKKEIYFVVNTVKKVVSAAKEFLIILVTDPRKILNFLKYLFDFEDILCTQEYMKVFVNAKMSQFSGLIGEAKKSTDEVFDEMRQKIVKWGELDTSTLPDGSPASMQSKYANPNADGDVHTNYFANLVTSNAKHANIAFEVSMHNTLQSNSELDSLLENLKDFANTQSSSIQKAVERVQGIMDSLKVDAKLDLADIFKKLLAVLGEALISSVKGFADLMFDLSITLIQVVQQLINETIKIPCVSDFLETIGIKNLSLLDIVLFVPSFFATITYKLITGEAPIKKENVEYLERQANSNASLLEGFLCETDEIKQKREYFIDIVTSSATMFAVSFAFAKAKTVSKVVSAIPILVQIVVFFINMPSPKLRVMFILLIIGLILSAIRLYMLKPNLLVENPLIQTGVNFIFLLFHIGVFILETLNCILFSSAPRGLGLMFSNIGAAIGNFVDLVKLDVAKPEIATALHWCEIALGITSTSIIIGNAATKLKELLKTDGEEELIPILG